MLNTRADRALLIRRGDLIQNFSCQMLGNYSKEPSFLKYQKYLKFQRLYVLLLSSYYRKHYLCTEFILQETEFTFTNLILFWGASF